ncbi:LysR family transcriptional regulator [Paucibacter sp. KBW04]|uniref:LysR family transcriptional regulator n=1 Tax=Paucibacter sp. KBW04 TaxID=2153361 RepID=UPI001E348C83|nr:LysR family transcriptional regulator [Paucibacter sp. KBW04]
MRNCIDDLDWNQLKAFLETAELGSLSAAARKLGLAQATLSRQVAAIEAQLGLTLFERVGKAMAITSSGQALLEHARLMGAAAEDLRLAASGQSQTVEGVVQVSATGPVAAYLLPPLLHRLAEIAPKLLVEVISSDAISDLMRREADIAIRHMRPEQPDLIGRFVRQASAGFYASRSWVQAHGHPRSAADARRCAFVGADRDGRYLAYLRGHGLDLKETNFSCYSADASTSLALMRAGLGIGAMMEEIAAEMPDLQRVLDEVAPIQFPIWLVTHRELRTSRRIRLVFDVLAEVLGHPGQTQGNSVENGAHAKGGAVRLAHEGASDLLTKNDSEEI